MIKKPFLGWGAALFVLCFSAGWASDDPATPEGSRYGDESKGGWAQPKFLESVRRVRAMNGNCDVIFVGDSLTEGWIGRGKPVWAKYYEGKKALCLGIGGDTTNTLLWRLDNTEGLKQLSPKAVVLLVGVNNMIPKNGLVQDPERTAEAIRLILDRILAMWPKSQIILNAIPPNGLGEPSASRISYDPRGITVINGRIKTFADGQRVHFIDWGSKIEPVQTPEGCSYKGLAVDRIHFDVPVYELWAKEINPILDRILGSGQ